MSTDLDSTMGKAISRMGICSVVSVDHGLSLEELGNFEKTLVERLRGSVLAVGKVKDVTCTDRLMTSNERQERLRQDDWLYFEAIDGKLSLEFLVGRKAVATAFLDAAFLWCDSECSGVTADVLEPVIEALVSAFKSKSALIAPSDHYYPGGWVTELVCEGLGILEVVDRLKSKGEPGPLGRDDLARFLGNHGPSRVAMLNQYFVIASEAH